MKESTDNSRIYWNLVKAIGIISIVIGHSCSKLVKFVYFYHLAIFFFLGGTLYNELKYGKDPYLNFSSKIKNNWKKYALFGIFFTLIHNFLFKCGMIINTNIYTFKDILMSCLNTLLFFGTETMGGALWFVPVFILSSTLFGIIIYYCNKISNDLKENVNSKLKNILLFMATIFCAIVGLYLNNENINLMLHIQTTFLVIPFFTFGYYFKKENQNPTKNLNIILFSASFIFLLFIYFKVNITIDLATNKIGNPYLFYLISFAGIYCCLYLAKIVSQLKNVNVVFNKIGTYSYEIMGLHFLVFKVIDFIYAKINGISDSMIYGAFPYAFKNLAPIYVIFGVGLPTIIFMLIDILKKIYKDNKSKIFSFLRDVFKKMSKFLHSKTALYLLIILAVIGFGYPIIKLGIMHNDELMSRYWSSQGFVTFYKHYFIEQLQKGRALSSLIIPFSMYLGFLGQKSITFKFFQILSILLTVYLFSKLLKKVFNNSKIGILYFVLFIAFLPITFEPTVPSVFVTFYNVSICLLIVSFSLFYDYLKSGKNSKLVLSMILFFVVETTYEAFVTYVLVYLLLALYEKGFKNILKDLKPFIVPVLVGILYLIFYVISSKIFPSNYDGNQISGVNIFSSLKIIYTLAKNTIPGIYLVSDKYQWLYNYYYNLNWKNILIIIITVIIFLAIIHIGASKEKNIKNVDNKSLYKIILLGIFLMVLPLLPISVASMYQKKEILNSLVALPVSYFSYFGSILILCIIVKYLSDKNQSFKYLLILIMAFNIFGVQLLNNVVSKEASSNFKRLEEIENFVSSKEIFSKFSNNTIYSEDIFVTKNTLVIHDSYWNEYASLHGVNVNFVNKSGKDDDINLYYYENEHIFLLEKNDMYYLFTKNINKNMSINLKNHNSIKIIPRNSNIETYDNWNVLYFTIKDKEYNECKTDLNNDTIFNECIDVINK